MLHTSTGRLKIFSTANKCLRNSLTKRSRGMTPGVTPENRSYYSYG
jgi:hypothetical protein